jgi:hypothetical protein
MERWWPGLGDYRKMSHFPGTSAGVAPICCGPAASGLFYPEIYVQKNHSMYYELSRNDSSFAGAVAVSFPVDLMGMKVFQK